MLELLSNIYDQSERFDLSACAERVRPKCAKSDKNFDQNTNFRCHSSSLDTEINCEIFKT